VFSDQPVARYRTAHRRFLSQVRQVFSHPPAAKEALVRRADATITSERVAEALLAAEQIALTG
jgi:hypothetical protein